MKSVETKNRCLLFDLDGTLTDSAPGILHSVRFALARAGISPDTVCLNAFIGPPLLDSFMQHAGMTQAQAQRAVQDYRECFVGQQAMFENSVYDGIFPALQALRDLQVPLAVATAKPEPYAVQIMDRFGLSPYFLQIHGATLDGTVHSKEQVIAKAMDALGKIGYDSFLMIGDREQDVIGAHRCGIPVCGVLWGYGDREELLRAGADRIIETPEQLTTLSKGALDR